MSNAQLNVGCRPYKSYTSFRAGGTPNTQQNDPYKLFTSLFGGTGMPPADMNALTCGARTSSTSSAAS